MDIRPPANSSEHREALEVLLSRPDVPATALRERVDVLIDYARKRSLSLDHCLLALHNGRIVAVSLCLDSPGRTTSVLLSSGTSLPRVAEAVVLLLAEARKQARRRDVQLLQGVVPPSDAHEATLYADAGFKHLAGLIYLERNLSQPIFPDQEATALDWVTYSPDTHELFARVVEGTYEDSLDCGSLNGVRDIEDIFASHRATGRFEPNMWHLGTVAGEPIGAILLADMEELNSYEVVYMGLLPQWRGRGYGSAFLRHGLCMARDAGAAMFTLSVDEKNVPARRLYSKFGLYETMRRDIWIAIEALANTGSKR